MLVCGLPLDTVKSLGGKVWLILPPPTLEINFLRISDYRRTTNVQFIYTRPIETHKTPKNIFSNKRKISSNICAVLKGRYTQLHIKFASVI